MMEGTSFFGISMDRRRNRRALVVLTYLAGAMAAVSLSLVKSRILGLSVLQLPMIMGFATLPFLIAYFVFGRIVSPFFMVPWFGRKPQVVDRGIGLSASVAPEEPPRDERELAERNAAYHYASTIIVAAGIVAVAIAEVTGGMDPRERIEVLYAGGILLFVLAFTLPQAVLLWRERDLPRDM